MAAWTQAHLDRLDRAIASGAVSVEFEDRKVTYRGIEKMMALRDMIARQLGVTTQRPRPVYPKYNRGLR